MFDTWRWIGVVLVASGGLMGCEASAGQQIQANVSEWKSEQTPDKLVDRGRAFASVGDTTRAEQYFAAALNAGGDERTITPMLLGVCIQDGRYRVAIQYAEGYVKKHPNDVSLRFLLGTLYAAIGDAPAAHHELTQVLEARPADADAHFALAVLLRDDEGDVVSADQHFREYLRLNPRGAHAEEAQASLLKSVP